MHVISVRSGDRRKYVHMHHYSGWTHGKQPVRLLDLWQIQSVFSNTPSSSRAGESMDRLAHWYNDAPLLRAESIRIGTRASHFDNFQRLVIADCICRARQGRMHAVQRAIQLQTIHAAMMEHIMSTRVSAQLPTKTTQKYEEFMDRFNKCAEAQEDLQ
ncbi:hypothetical protein OSTOST_22353 [Ostertagia ostertagi]